jgi:ubiquitin-protein ligase
MARNKFEKYEQKELSGRDNRLLHEWKELDAFCAKNRHIAYIIRRINTMDLPVEYEIQYKLTSIVGVEDTEPPRKPIFANLHILQIELPNNYPAATGNPVFHFITTRKNSTIPWHPNIRYSGNFKGRVCLNIKEMGVMASLKTLVQRVEQYLRYELYHAQDAYPYPEDQNVAQWVREEAEPNNWLSIEDLTKKPKE